MLRFLRNKDKTGAHAMRASGTPPVLGYHASLDTPMLALTPEDVWTLRDSFEGTFIFGATGSGKTSGSGRALAQAFLKAGYGGLVLCAKPEEADRWEAYARECGRPRSVLRMRAGGALRFNFLTYLMELPVDQGGGNVLNVVAAFLRILEASRVAKEGEKGAEAPFWKNAMTELLRHAITALYHARGRVDLAQLLDLVASTPQSEEHIRDPKWVERSFCAQTLIKMQDAPAVPLAKRLSDMTFDYFGRRMPYLDPKTRSNLVFTLTSEIDPFLTEPLHSLFCTDTTVTPELTHEGAVLVLDLPIKRLHHTAAVAQSLMKYLWQRSVEARAIAETTRPVFLWADEYQFFISGYDLEFQSTARSSRAATVYLTQNLPSLYAQIGGTIPKHRTDAILGNFQTKVFHANTDHDTNVWAAEMVGKMLHWRENYSDSESMGQGTSDSLADSWSVTDTVSESDSESRASGQQGGHSTGSSYNYSAGWQGTPAPSSSNQLFSLNSDSVNRSWGKNESRSSGWSFARTLGLTRGKSTGATEGQSRTRGVSRNESRTRGQGAAQQKDYIIDPSEFGNRLKKGGEGNGYLVTAIVVQGGKRFAKTGMNWTPAAFSQVDRRD